MTEFIRMTLLVLANDARKALAANVARGVYVTNIRQATPMNQRLANSIAQRWNRRAKPAERVVKQPIQVARAA